MRESAIEKICRLRVESYGGRMPKWVSPGNRGVQDRIVLLPHGYVAFVEFKRPGSPIDRLQAEWLVWMRDHGHRAFIIESAAQFQAEVLFPYLEHSSRHA